MTDKAEIQQAVKALRESQSAKGRTYSRTGVSPEWLATETSEYCKSQGWANTLSQVPNSQAWLVVTDGIAVLVEGASDKFVVTVQDLSPVYLKTGLAINGVLALTGLGLVALPLAGATAWKASARKSKVTALVSFVDARVQARGQGSQPMPTTPPEPRQPTASDLGEKLKAILSLKEQGLLSEEEYQTKREQLLKQL
jgi:hypothetical protein